MRLFIKVGSVTNAQRGQRILSKHGFRANIKRVENPSKADGCGYALEVSSNDSAPVSLLEKNGIKVRGAERR